MKQKKGAYDVGQNKERRWLKEKTKRLPVAPRDTLSQKKGGAHAVHKKGGGEERPIKENKSGSIPKGQNKAERGKSTSSTGKKGRD